MPKKTQSKAATTTPLGDRDANANTGGGKLTMADALMLSEKTATTIQNTLKRSRPSSTSNTKDPSTITLPGQEKGEIEIDMSCDDVRRRIVAFIESGEVSGPAEFQRAIGISGSAYAGFMKLKGEKEGMYHVAYRAAFAFFKKRELAGVGVGKRSEEEEEEREPEKKRAKKMVKDKKKEKKKDRNDNEDEGGNSKDKKRDVSGGEEEEEGWEDEDENEDDGGKKSKSKNKSKTQSQKKTTSAGKTKDGDTNSAYDVSSIHLDGEDTESVPIYDTCDEIRRKINAHLRKSGVSQASLLRSFASMLPPSSSSSTSSSAPKSLSNSSLLNFLRKKGPCEGNSSMIFYAAYVYFEKLRLKDAKKNKNKKTKMREEMERVWGGEGGMSRRDNRGGYFAHKDEIVWMDKYGWVHFDRR